MKKDRRVQLLVQELKIRAVRHVRRKPRPRLIEDGLEKKVIEMGADDFIQKPYDIEKLLQKVRSFLPK